MSRKEESSLEKSLTNLGAKQKQNSQGSISLESALKPSDQSDDLTNLIHEKKVTIPIHYELPLKQARQKFKESFFRTELEKHQNISMLAKFLGINRRSIHRTIKECNLNPSKKSSFSNEQYYQNLKAYTSFRELLEEYEQQITDKQKWAEPQIKESFIEKHKTDMTKNLKQMTWKQAKKDFEERYFKFKISQKTKKTSQKQLAKQIGIREETLSRKLKTLKIF